MSLTPPRAPRRYILLIEDNEDDITLTHRALSKASHDVALVVAKDGLQGLDACYEMSVSNEGDSSRRPLFILLDLKLPKLNGVEVFRCLQEDERTKGLPIILISSSKEEITLLESQGLGAEEYLFKPITPDDFVRLLKQYGNE